MFHITAIGAILSKTSCSWNWFGVTTVSLSERWEKQKLTLWPKNSPDDGFPSLILSYVLVRNMSIKMSIILYRDFYRVSIGKVGETEVDFVAEKPNDKLYIQVTESMLSPETRERELRPCFCLFPVLFCIRDHIAQLSYSLSFRFHGWRSGSDSIPDNYEKIVLSMDRSYINSYDGIKSLYLIDWLLCETNPISMM